ncbi:MAG TPA: hypothetical protein VMG41_07680 [Gemmatimonadales bacterium]|nr:hypothetical protein [Gemmatimonadales bacterium]
MSDVEQQVERLLADLDQAWPRGYTAVLFGSTAREQRIAGWSDINLLLIAEDLSPEALRAARPALLRWREGAETLPLLFGPTEWRRSTDAYPLEIAEMRTAYRLLRGSDPLAGMKVAPEDLRMALEREFRGKLMRLRQGYALMETGSPELSEFLRTSASSVLLLCRGLLILRGETVPRENGEVLEAAGKLAGFPAQAVGRVVAARADERWRCTEEDVRGYLAAVDAAARYVDNFQTGART